MEMGEGYAQSNEHLREMEKEAYLEGNMTLRDWEDKYKKVLQETIYYETFKGDTKMSINETKRTRFNNLLMERWGYEKKKEEVVQEEKGGHPGQSCDEAHPGKPHSVNEDYDDKRKKEELEEGAIEDAERDAQQAINKAKSEIASVEATSPVQNTDQDNMGGDMTDPMEEDALRKKIREVLRNSFNAKS